MNNYKIRFSITAEYDIRELAFFLLGIMSKEGANRYLDAMVSEIMSLSLFADLYTPSRYADIRRYHPFARRMVAHNKRWVYIFHIDNETVIIDRIIPSKTITK